MNRTFRLGLFIVTTLAILVVAIFLIGNKESLFKSTYQVKADFQNVAGLTDGADVRVAGLHQGSVKYIRLPNRPDGKVAVVMDLQSSTRNILKKDSVAAIRSEGLIGDKYVEISFGSESAPRLKDGDTIESEPPFDISNLVKKTSDLLDNAKDVVQNLDGTASNMKSISAKINSGSGTVGALINDKTVYKQAAAATSALDDDMEALKHNFLLRGFFKKRGYEDPEDLTKHQISRLPAGTPQTTFDYDGRAIFDKPDTAKLKEKKALNEAGEYLESNKFGLAVVVASAGMKGETDKDRVLTEARASAVRDFLAQNFRLDDTRIKTIGLGKTDGTRDEGKVEILVYPGSVEDPHAARKPGE
jgi:phospholipid/cholesterol/gamma-HCH transport system substrate-binding protein